MDDIRDKFPMPPCINCGRGMCVKDDGGESYRCPVCGQRFLVLPVPYGPIHNPEAMELIPLAVSLRLTITHWLMAMGQAMDNLQYEKMAALIETQKRWLDEVGLPMADHVRNVRRGAAAEQAKRAEPVEPMAETSEGGWLSDERLRNMR